MIHVRIPLHMISFDRGGVLFGMGFCGGRNVQEEGNYHGVVF